MRSTSSESVVSAKKLEEYVSTILTQKCLTAIEQMDPTDQKSVAEMLKLYARFLDVQNQGRNETSGHLDYLKNAEAMLKAIPWSLGRKGVPPKLGPWSETAVELRAGEQLELMAGVAPGDEADLKNLRLRDERSKP